MIKECVTTIKAEVFDGSEEMMSRYPIRHYESPLYVDGIGYVLDVPSKRYENQMNHYDLRVGQYIITNKNGRLVNMWPDDFYDLFPEAEND